VIAINERVKFTMLRKPLLVTNRGPRKTVYLLYALRAYRTNGTAE